MSIRPFQRRRAKGFTLLEILIVGALIALFAGLAIFNIQQQFDNNVRKATIGEVKQIATALDFAYNDVGFFPKLCFLDNSIDTLRQDSFDQFGNETAIFRFLHALGVDSSPRAGTVLSSWSGPYFSGGQFRGGAATGRGGTRGMVFNEPGSGAAEFRWPLDNYNNPYLVYMLDIDRSNPSAPFLRFVTDSVGRTGNFTNAVISYGPNQVPGGGVQFVPEGDPLAAPEASPFGLRVYRGSPGPRGPAYELLAPSQLTPVRASAWSVEYYRNVASEATLSQSQNVDGFAVGMTDAGSDDIVIVF